MADVSSDEAGKRISDERTLRDDLMASGMAAAEQWLATRANRRMSDVNQRRLVGHILNALWGQIEQAAINIASWIAEDAEAELNEARAQLAEIGKTDVEWGVRGGGGTFRVDGEAAARWHTRDPVVPMIVVRRLAGEWREVAEDRDV